ncbi:hypothetical protein [Brucella abortus]|uniref:hypothetical protein n=1 Tax=Brucella abortus TaxID=235 RepID=UPI003F50E68A
MRGAKGLLISITGGRDMTLFEVDEAATRIREEVDPEANIILGATFDEGLEGVIRVSVVATGIDKQQGDAAPAPLEFRQPVKPTAAQAKPMAPHGALRPPVAEQPRQADPVAQVIQAAEAEMPVAPAAPAASAEPEFRPQSRIFQAPAPEAFERAPVARAPMQPAQAMHAPQPQQYQQPQMHEQPVREPRPAPRMPAVSDFPPVAQAEINARRAPQQPVQEEPRGPMGLLKRLTHGLSRREEEQPAAVWSLHSTASRVCAQPNRAARCSRIRRSMHRAAVSLTIRAVRSRGQLLKKISSKSRLSCAASRTDLYPVKAFQSPPVFRRASFISSFTTVAFFVMPGLQRAIYLRFGAHVASEHFLQKCETVLRWTMRQNNELERFQRFC